MISLTRLLRYDKALSRRITSELTLANGRLIHRVVTEELVCSKYADYPWSLLAQSATKSL